MNYQYAIEVLQKAAFELGGEILTGLALESGQSAEVEKLAKEILFGNFLGKAKAKNEERFLELIQAIKLLQDQKES